MHVWLAALQTAPFRKPPHDNMPHLTSKRPCVPAFWSPRGPRLVAPRAQEIVAKLIIGRKWRIDPRFVFPSRNFTKDSLKLGLKIVPTRTSWEFSGSVSGRFFLECFRSLRLRVPSDLRYQFLRLRMRCVSCVQKAMDTNYRILFL